MRMHHIVTCPPHPQPLYNIFLHYLTNGMIYERKVIEHKMRVLIFPTTFVWNISHSSKN